MRAFYYFHIDSTTWKTLLAAYIVADPTPLFPSLLIIANNFYFITAVGANPQRQSLSVLNLPW